MKNFFINNFNFKEQEADVFNALYVNLKILKPVLFDKCIQTAIIANKIAVELNIENIHNLRVASLIANLGLQASDLYLSKDSFLNEQELDQIKRHTILSAEIAKKIGCKKEIIEIIYYHHEFPNGKGYYKAQTYPKESDIINISDIFQGCVYNKTHKVPLTLQEAIQVSLEDNYLKNSKFSSQEKTIIENVLTGAYSELFEFNY